jgi:hypothetical protein
LIVDHERAFVRDRAAGGNPKVIDPEGTIYTDQFDVVEHHTVGRGLVLEEV